MATTANFMTAPKQTVAPAPAKTTPPPSGGQGNAVAPNQVQQFQPATNAPTTGNASYAPPSGKAPAIVGPQPGTWTPPQLPPASAGGQPPAAAHGGGSSNFWGAANPWSGDASNDHYNQINNLLPVAQFDQNNYQYMQDYNAAMYQFNQNNALAQNQNAFQQSLSTQQQQMAEWQAQQAASQWNQQFGHTQQMDMLGYGLQQQGLGLQGQEIANTGAYQQGLIGNQANLNNFQNQYWQGQNANDAFANQSTAQYQQGLIGNQQYANQATAQYQQGLIQMQGQANNIQQQYQQGLISNAERETALKELTQQQNNSFLYAQMSQQAQQAQMERENQIRMANIGAYGRSQSPQANWSRSWG